jgi:DNA-binding NarL/FixJ family response regulator
MSESEASELRMAARRSRTVSMVADRLGRALWPSLGGERQHDLLVVPSTAVGQPIGDDGHPNGSDSASKDASRQWHGTSRGPAKLASTPEPTPDVATWHGPLDVETVLIIDDCTLFRENLAAILAARGIAVAGMAWDLHSLVATFDKTSADLVLLNMATRDSHLLMQAVTDISPGARIIVVGTPEDDEEKIIACAELGVVGYHMRSESLDDLISLIHNVAGGKSIFPPRVSAVLLRRLSNLASQPQRPGRGLVLTAREAQILKMLELGRSNRDIAAQLDIAVHTVKNHVHNLLSKLGVNTRAEAAARSRAMSYERSARKN